MVKDCPMKRHGEGNCMNINTMMTMMVKENKPPQGQYVCTVSEDNLLYLVLKYKDVRSKLS